MDDKIKLLFTDIDNKIEELMNQKWKLYTEHIKTKLKTSLPISHISLETVDYVSTDNFDIEGWLTLGEYDFRYVYNKWKGDYKLTLNDEQKNADLDDCCKLYDTTTEELGNILAKSFNNNYINFEQFYDD